MSEVVDSSLYRPSVAINFASKQGQRLVAAAALIHTPTAFGKEASAISSTTVKIELFEFLDNDQFSHLDSFLQQVGDVSLYCPEDAADKVRPDGRKINNILSSYGDGIETILLKRANFLKKADTINAVLNLVGKTSHTTNTVESEMPVALGCLQCLIHNLHLMDDSRSNMDSDEQDGIGLAGCRKEYELSYGSLNACMRLDSAAAETVNLMPRADQPSQFGSLFGLLNRCKTKQGSRLLERWLRHPLLDVQEINGRLDMVGELLEATQHRNALREGPLRAMPDLDAVVTKMYKKNGGLSEMFRLYVFAQSLPNYAQLLQELLADNKTPAAAQSSDSASEECAGDADIDAGAGSEQGEGEEAERPGLGLLRERFLEPLHVLASKFSVFQQLVEHVVDMDALPDLRVDCAHDEALGELAQEMQGLEEEAEALLQQARRGWASFADIKLELNSPHGMILRTTRADDERQLRERCPSVRILSILKNGVHLTTPALESISTRYDEARGEYSHLQEAIVEQAVATALTYVPAVEAAAALVAELDVLLAFATAAACSPGQYVRPLVRPRGGGVLRLQGARHPCVELMDSVPQFIANDYDLVRGSSNFQIITGPNMGGKSTYIRAVGCVAVLAQVGMYVPCESAELSVVDCILARVGAGDAVQKGVSTFMAEMLESSVILQTATRDSLIIIDELGRGTSTFDGFGLAWSISDFLVTQVQCLCLFATHFHELTALQQQHPHAVANKHVAAHVDRNQVVMLYKLAPGPCTQSFGVHVAGMARFPEQVLRDARKKARALEHIDSTGESSERNLKQQRVGEANDSAGAAVGAAAVGAAEGTVTAAEAAEKVRQFRDLPELDQQPAPSVVRQLRELFPCAAPAPALPCN